MDEEGWGEAGDGSAREMVSEEYVVFLSLLLSLLSSLSLLDSLAGRENLSLNPKHTNSGRGKDETYFTYSLLSLSLLLLLSLFLLSSLLLFDSLPERENELVNPKHTSAGWVKAETYITLSSLSLSLMSLSSLLLSLLLLSFL